MNEERNILGLNIDDEELARIVDVHYGGIVVKKLAPEEVIRIGEEAQGVANEIINEEFPFQIMNAGEDCNIG